MFPAKKAPVPFEVKVYDTIYSKSADYLVMNFIGQGGYGKVAKCVDLKTADAAAIKIHIDCRSYEIEKEIAMLEEIKALDADRHNLVKFIDSFTFKGLSCLAFEMLDKSLWDFMKNRKTGLHLNEIRPIAQQLLVAFQALKSIGIIHADLKPDNVMLVDHKYEPFRVKLIDFGCSLKAANVRTGTLLQNVNYRAPEVTLGLPISEAIDMWGLGCLLAFLYFNNDLFPSRCKFHVMQRVCDLLGKPENHLLDAGRNTWQFFHRDILETGWILKNPEQYNEATGIKPWITEWGFAKIDDLKEAVVTQNDSGLLEDRRRFARLLKMLLRVDAGRRVTPDAALGFNFITMAHLQKNINNSADDASELMKFASKDYLKGCGDSSRMAAGRQSPDLADETKSPDCGVVRKKGLYRFVYVDPPDHLPLLSPVSYWASRRLHSDKNRSSEIEMVTPISCNISFLEENDIEPSGTKASAGLDIDGTHSATSEEEVPAQTSLRRESPTHGARYEASSAHEISNACLPPANACVARGVVVSTPANRGSVLRNSRPKARTLPKLPTESHPSVSPKKNKKAKKNSLKNDGGLSSSDGHSHSITANACGVVVSTPAHRGSVVLRSSRPKARTLPEPPTQAGVSPNRPTKEKKARHNNFKKNTTTANVNNGDRAPASAPNNSKPVDLDSYNNPGTEVPAQTSCKRESPSLSGGNSACSTANAGGAGGVVVKTPAHRGPVVLRGSRPQARPLPELPTRSHPSVSPKKNKKAKKNSLKNGGGLSSSDGHSHSSTANACGAVVSTPAHRGSVVLRSSRPKARTLPEPPTQAGVSPNRPTKEKKAENNNLKKKMKNSANVNNGDRAPASALSNYKPVDLDSYNPGREVPAQTSCKRALPSLSGGHSACSNANAGGAGGVVVRTPSHRGSVVLRGSRPQARPLPELPTRSRPSVSPNRPTKEKKAKNNNIKNKKKTTANETNEDRAPPTAPFTSKPVDLDSYNPGREVPAQSSCKREVSVVVRTPAHRDSVVLRSSRPQVRTRPEPPQHSTSPSVSPIKRKMKKNKETANVTQEDRAPASATKCAEPVDVLDNKDSGKARQTKAIDRIAPQVRILPEPPHQSISVSPNRPLRKRKAQNKKKTTSNETCEDRAEVTALNNAKPVDVLDDCNNEAGKARQTKAIDRIGAQVRILPDPPSQSISVSQNRPKKAKKKNLQNKKETTVNEAYEDRAQATALKNGKPVLRSSSPQVRILPEPRHRAIDVSPDQPKKTKKSPKKKTKKATANVPDQDIAPAAVGKIGDHVILLRRNHYKEPVKARQTKVIDRIVKFARRISSAVASVFRR